MAQSVNSLNPQSTALMARLPQILRDDQLSYYNVPSLTNTSIYAFHDQYNVSGSATALPIETGLYMLVLGDYSNIGIFAVYNDGTTWSTKELVDTGAKFSAAKSTASMVNFYFDATTKILSIENLNGATQACKLYRLA